MNVEIINKDSFPIAYIELDGEMNLKLERGAMIFHDPQVRIKSRMNSNGAGGLIGIAKAVFRSKVSGESFFISETEGSGNIALAPSLPGTIVKLNCGENQYFLNDGAFLAMDSSMSYQMHRQKAGQALMGGQGGFYVMETTGSGDILINAYGTILPVELDNDELIVDNDHVVAWSNTLNYDIRPDNGIVNSWKSGEGLVNHFSGTGTVYVQSLNMASMAQNILPYVVGALNQNRN